MTCSAAPDEACTVGGTNTMTFTFTTGVGSQVLMTADDSALGGVGTIVFAQATATEKRSLAFNKALVVDTSAPSVVLVTSNLPGGTYGVGHEVPLAHRALRHARRCDGHAAAAHARRRSRWTARRRPRC